MSESVRTGATVWHERRTRPVVALFGVPTAFLIVMAFAAHPWQLQAVAGLAAVVFGALGVRAWPRALIEAYTVTDEAIRVERPHEPDVSVPLQAIERAVLRGDRVSFDTQRGDLTLHFVRHQRSLLRALERVAPNVVIERKLDAFCRT